MLWTAIAFVVLYSIIINYIFGHPTYWKSFPHEFMKYVLKLTKQIVNQDMKKINQSLVLSKRSQRDVFQSMNSNVLVDIISYLNPYEASVLSQVSRNFQDLCQNRIVWRHMMENVKYSVKHFDNCSEINQLLDISAIDSRLAFFEVYQKLIQKILSGDFTSRSDGCIIRVDGAIYDLSSFQFKHPGGQGILLEWNGKDASRIFRLANHSKTAKTQAFGLAIWSDIKALGKRGLPQYVRFHFLNKKSIE